MSGISGCINLDENINVEMLHNMTNIIRHRGPDDEGYYFYNKNMERYAYGEDTIKDITRLKMTQIEKVYNEKFILGLGYRGLRINEPFIEHHQPMTFDNITIIFNGNIYNYKELKGRLQKLGKKFITSTDTEVIIKSYIQWGEKCVDYLNGDWAFAIWDKENEKLFCSRDRIGIKPFYYYFDDNSFIFSSEIKQIIEYGIKAEVNESILFSFLFYGFENYSNETFFKNIYSLEAGENLSLSISNNKFLTINKYKYWEVCKKEEETNENFEMASHKIGLELQKSIKNRLYSDAEVGSCLSGGIDSSSIVTLACEEFKSKGINTLEFKTFTACYDDSDDVDERYYSDLVVENSNCSNIKVKPNPKKLEDDLEHIIWHQDEPFGGFSIFAGWCVMEEASKNGVKVLLDGQGGDETLLGYERFYAYKIKDRIKRLELIAAIKEFKLSSENSKLSKKMLLGYLVYFNNMYIRKKRLKNKNMKFLNSIFFYNYIKQNIVDDLLRIKDLEEAKIMAINSSLSHLLRYEDRNTMAHSIEARVPFLDHNFVKIAFNQSSEYKLRNGWTKANIRKFMEDKMPHEVTYRKEKLGFSVPKDKWINELSDCFLEDLLNNPVSAKYFNMDNIKRAFKNKTHTDFRIKFVIVEIWMRIFISN